MPRRRGAENREVVADAIYGSTLVEKFVCSMMWDGKKSTAQKIFYSSLKKLEERYPALDRVTVSLSVGVLLSEALEQLEWFARDVMPAFTAS